MTDGHYAGYQEMLEKVDWDKYGVVDGVARDPRCENCMVHCGYDPSGALGTNYQRGDNWKNFKYNFGRQAKAVSPKAATVNAFNGVSIGKGHLAEAKAAINSRVRHERRAIRFLAAKLHERQCRRLVRRTGDAILLAKIRENGSLREPEQIVRSELTAR